MSAEIKSKTPLFAQKEKEGGGGRAGWWYDSCVRRDFEIVISSWEELGSPSEERRGAYSQEFSFLISLLAAEYGVHIEVLVTFKREGQGFDGAFFCEIGHTMSRSTARAHLLEKAAALVDRTVALAHYWQQVVSWRSWVFILQPFLYFFDRKYVSLFKPLG